MSCLRISFKPASPSKECSSKLVLKIENDFNQIVICNKTGHFHNKITFDLKAVLSNFSSMYHINGSLKTYINSKCMESV